MTDETPRVRLHDILYTLLDEGRQGGQGRLYKARTPDGTTVALKELNTRDDNDREERLTRVQRVRSPHLAQTLAHGIGRHGGIRRAYVVSEWVEGSNLEECLADGMHFPEEEAIRIAREMLLGTQALHRADIIHRDLKPSNVMVDEDGQVKITDMGIARHAAIGTLTGTMAVGSPLYMPPEQAAGSPEKRSDLFSLGLTLYEITTRTKPRPTDAIHTPAIERTHWNLYDDLGYSPDFVEFIQVLCAFEAEDRYDVEQALTVLETIGDSYGVGGHVDDEGTDPTNNPEPTTQFREAARQLDEVDRRLRPPEEDFDLNPLRTFVTGEPTLVLTHLGLPDPREELAARRRGRLERRAYCTGRHPDDPRDPDDLGNFGDYSWKGDSDRERVTLGERYQRLKRFALYAVAGNFDIKTRRLLENRLGTENFDAYDAAGSTFWTNFFGYAAAFTLLYNSVNPYNTPLEGADVVLGVVLSVMASGLEAELRTPSIPTIQRTGSLLGSMVSIPARKLWEGYQTLGNRYVTGKQPDAIKTSTTVDLKAQ
jgi:serine/threonine protein kinase